MRTKPFAAFGTAAALALASGNVLAGVSEEEAARLGGELTPVGAERAGNAEGTIPEWTGGLTQGERPGVNESLPNPYSDDEPRFTITADNYQEYEDHLTPGQIKMFETYPETWEMHVYPTRRSAAFPEKVYEETRENATRAELIGVDGVQNATTGFPFPIPHGDNAGAQVVQNHRLAWGGQSVRFFFNQAVVSQSGAYSLIRLPQEIKIPYANYDTDVEEVEERNLLALFLQAIVSPARLAGAVLLVHEPVDYRGAQRQVWAYNPGQRRVRRAPNVEHDNPGTASDGLRTNDQNGVFNGSLERYNWELVGKREIFIPYNAYRIDDKEIDDYDRIVEPGHANPDLMRYELHRVWVVDARVREGTSHLYARRTFYIDEDSWKMALVDIYDRRGNLWRFQEGHLKTYYHMPLVQTAFEVVYDLQANRYLAMAMDNNDEGPDWTWSAPDSHWTPGALRRAGFR